MKSRKEHRVPLSPPAIELLQALPRKADYVFISGRKDTAISNTGMMMVLRRMGRGDVTTHGFRSSFKDWAAERTNYPNIVSEMALAHAIGDKVEAAYRRGDLFNKRRKLMEVWASFCAKPQPKATADNVVIPLRKVEAHA